MLTSTKVADNIYSLLSIEAGISFDSKGFNTFYRNLSGEALRRARPILKWTRTLRINIGFATDFTDGVSVFDALRFNNHIYKLIGYMDNLHTIVLSVTAEVPHNLLPVDLGYTP